MANNSKDQNRIPFLRSLRGKLILLFLAVSIIPLVVAVGTAVFQIYSSKKATDKVGKDYLPSITHLGSAEIALLRIVTAGKDHIMASDHATLNALEVEIGAQEQDLTKALIAFESTLDTGTEAQAFREFQDILDDFMSTHRQIIRLSKSDASEQALALSIGSADDLLQQALDLMNTMHTANIDGADKAQQAADRANWIGSITTIVISLLTVVVVAGLAFRVANSITKPILTVTQGARNMAAGDVNQMVVVINQDETGVLANAFNRMAVRLRAMLRVEKEQRKHLQATIDKYVDYMALVAGGNLAVRTSVDDGEHDDNPLNTLGHNLNELTASLQRMIVQTHDAVNDLSATGNEILSAATQQAASASEQSAAISQATITVDEVKNIAEQSVTRARKVADTSQRTVEVSRSGHQAMQQTIASMAHIKTRVEGIAANILALSEQTQQIGEIIATVNDIAAQSNMLALNASVEAARAGEHGKGFAVVAVEVRNLAEQSRQATTQIRAILSDIQKATNATVMVTEEGGKGVDEGVRLAAQAQDVIEQLSTVIDESAQTAMQMVVSGEQQASGVEQIALAMQSINQATAQSLSSTRQAEKAAQELNDLARSLTETVEQYQL